MDQVVKQVFEHLKTKLGEVSEISRLELRRAYIEINHNYSKASFYDFVERSTISGALERKDMNTFKIIKKFWGEIQ